MAVDIFLETRTGEKFQFPVLPAELKLSGASGNQSVDTIKNGEVTTFGHRKLRTFEIEAFFPVDKTPSFVRTKDDFLTPEQCVAQMSAYQEAREPLKFITTGLGMNAFWVSVEAFSWRHGAGGGDVNYSLSLKEYRPFGNRAKTLDKLPDLFDLGAEQKVYEGAGGIREPAGFAIGDRVQVSGVYFSSPNGARAIWDAPADFLTRKWSVAQEAVYKAITTRVEPLKNRRCIIVDVVRSSFIQTPAAIPVQDVLPNSSPYCVADISTRRRIGWVSESQLSRI